MSFNTINTRPRPIIGLFTLSVPCLALFAGFLGLILRPALLDPDYYWQLEAGRLIVAAGALPSSDTFSFTFSGETWVLHEWLSQVLLYAAFAALGPLGVKLMVGMVGTATVGLVYAAARRILTRPLPAAWLAGIFYVVLFVYASPRPQIFSYAFLAAYLYILTSFKYEKDTRLLPVLPVLMIPWVNAHGAYVIGIVLIAVFGISEWLVRRFGTAGGEDGYRLRPLALAAVLTLLASLCSPYFIAHWVYPFELMGMDVTRYLTDWESPNFHEPLGKLYLLLVAGFCFIQIYRSRRPDFTELAVPGLLIVAGFSSIRHGVLAVMAMIIFAAPALRDGLTIPARLSAEIGWLQQQWRGRVARGKPLGGAQGPLNLAVAAALALATIAYYPTARTTEAAMVEESLPVGAAQFVIDHGIKGRMFNTFHFGGYLTHRFYPERKIFIDGRPDIFGDAFFKEYFAIDRGHRSWSTLFDKYKIDFVICDPDAAIRQLLLTRGDFRLVYDDAAASVLVHDDARFAAIPTLPNP
jgi:hypothetical protein